MGNEQNHDEFLDLQLEPAKRLKLTVAVKYKKNYALVQNSISTENLFETRRELARTYESCTK